MKFILVFFFISAVLIEGSPEKFASKLKNKSENRNCDSISIFDANFDGKRDVIAWHTYMASSGENKSAIIYFNTNESFSLSNNSESISNPIFHSDSKIITSYYFAIGGGEAMKLKWNNLNKFDTIEHIKINILQYEPIKIEYKVFRGREKTIQIDSLFRLENCYYK